MTIDKYFWKILEIVRQMNDFYFAYENREIRILGIQVGLIHPKGSLEMCYLDILNTSSFGCRDKKVTQEAEDLYIFI